ncbi:hypothetical protein [Tengunoibacter tsumagoiensis]|uniref:Uncharacterized protein n=1 Tax=Tengunoibacter tsumagoiensis TaxID=2014871 RepID=A0A402A314_9CHLR|nr:hypothetical protein [Tengunoibacter tsumagoiensis]GCE13435.1 hypothetical protein KTT_32940 [Tengunoibacter tsumagoiensis]
MFWQISKLILTLWRNRLRQLFRRAPYLWFIVLLLGMCYLSGAYLAHDFFYQALLPLASGRSQNLVLNSILLSGFFCSFGISAFILLIAFLLLTPDDTVLKRIFLPLPISATQQRCGVVLPGFMLLLASQCLLWVPILPIFVQLGLAQPLPLLGATIFGLLCYNAMTLAFHQGILYVTTLLFGADRAAIRTTAMGLTMSVGLILLMIPLIYSGVELVRGQIGWLIFLPSYWMLLVLDSRPIIIFTGVALLLSVSFICALLYLFFIERSDKLVLGTKGYWVPLRGLTFPRNFFLTSCVYELKSLLRDEQLVIGLFMIIGIWLAAIGANSWIGKSNVLLNFALLQVAGYLITMMLCAAAQLSWGRDRRAYQVLASVPLQRRRFLDGKLSTTFLVSAGCWLLLMGLLVWITNTSGLLLELLPLLLVGNLFSFCLGIALPYSPDDPLSMLPALFIVTVLSLPAYIFAQYIQGILEQVPGGVWAHIGVQYGGITVILGALYIAIHIWSQKKLEASHD